MEEYEKVYNDFWKELIEDEDGNIDKDSMMRELNDYAFLLDEVPKVYMEVTGGRISKPNTYAYEVINVAWDYFEEVFNKGIKDD